MGNRAVIGFLSKEGIKNKDSVGIYLHWNGGRDSVEGFLATAKQYGVRTNEDYGVARLIQIIANTLGGTLSLGVDQIKNLDCDNYDNGLYWVDNNFNIVGREYNKNEEQTEYPLEDFIKHCKKANDLHFIGETQ